MQSYQSPANRLAEPSNWTIGRAMSSVGDAADRFLDAAGFDRGPWVTVAFAAGIGAWFVLPERWLWLTALAACFAVATAALAVWRGRDDRQAILVGTVVISLALAAGLSTIWARSTLVGTPGIERPTVAWVDGRVLERDEQPALDRVRLTLAMRDSKEGRAYKVRINVPTVADLPALEEGARVRLRARLMPPAPPMLPGAYDFARAAWFKGLAATGSLIGDIEIVEPADTGSFIARTQRALSAHVLSRVDGSAGAIAAAFASGDRGAITEADDEAMRDSGLTHLLSISGVHVSAVIAAGFFLTAKLLALWPYAALRWRIPVVAAAVGALAGVSYTLLTGAEVPTVRSCIGALLVLVALMLGREALSMRMVAVAALAVMLLWPEALAGPSFQMSFAAVITIVALHSSTPMQSFLAPREEPLWQRYGRRVAALFVTGMAIELALTPIVLFHFHRSGVYGAFANVLAIPLVTFASMPFIALALVLDIVGLGAPFWWLTEKSLDLLLAIAHFTADRPTAVRLFPQMGFGTILTFTAGFFWLSLWKGPVRLLGLGLTATGIGLLLATPVPDLLISRDGRHVAIAGEHERVLVLREGRSDYALDNLLELSASRLPPMALADWPGARCSRDFCVFVIERGGRGWTVLASRSRDQVEERALAAACSQSDIVIADRYLPRSCKPRWLKADRRYLNRHGGLSIDLANGAVIAVASGQGSHGWWRAAS
jgi:competence protein ComEC